MRTRWLTVFAATALVILASSLAAASAQESPDGLIRRVSQQLLVAIGSAKGTAKDGRQVYGLVEQNVLPYVDFQRATSLVAGRSWRVATPDQQKQLTEQFRSMVLFSITAALARGTYDGVEVEPVHDDPADTGVYVHARVLRRAGAPIPLTYRMEDLAAGWKIDDVSVSGSWLTRSYQPLFSAEIGKGGIDGLIMTLTKRNRQRDPIYPR